jgi:peptide chain release factor 1
VTDHRLQGDDKNYPLQKIISGDLDDVIAALRTADNAERLSNI